MKTSIKVEMRKAFYSPLLWLSLVIGVALVASNVAYTYIEVTAMRDSTTQSIERGIPLGYAGCSVSIWWIATSMMSYGSITFSNIWPILAAIPFGYSYSQELQNGVVLQYVTRAERKHYFCAKYLAVFLTGGIVVAFPVLLDFLINTTICSDDSLAFLAGMSPIGDYNFMAELYFLSPWGYAIVWCALDFLWGGAAAVLSFLAGGKLRFPILATLVPFALMYGVSVFGNYLTLILEDDIQRSPIALAMSSGFGHNPGWLIFLYIIAFSLISFVIGYRRVVKDDLL